MGGVALIATPPPIDIRSTTSHTIEFFYYAILSTSARIDIFRN